MVTTALCLTQDANWSPFLASASYYEVAVASQLAIQITKAAVSSTDASVLAFEFQEVEAFAIAKFYDQTILFPPAHQSPLGFSDSDLTQAIYLASSSLPILSQLGFECSA